MQGKTEARFLETAQKLRLSSSSKMMNLSLKGSELVPWALAVTLQFSYNVLAWVLFNFYPLKPILNQGFLRLLVLIWRLTPQTQIRFIIITRCLTLSVGWNYTEILDLFATQVNLYQNLIGCV